MSDLLQLACLCVGECRTVRRCVGARLLRAGASLAQHRGLPSRVLHGSAYMCEDALPSVRVLVWMCTQDRWSWRPSTATPVRFSGNG